MRIGSAIRSFARFAAVLAGITLRKDRTEGAREERGEEREGEEEVALRRAAWPRAGV